MKGEGQSLHRIIDAVPDIVERALNKTIPVRSQEMPKPRSNHDQGKEQENLIFPRKICAPLHMPSKIRNGVADDLRQRHFNRDIQKQKGDTQQNAARIFPEKGQHLQERG